MKILIPILLITGAIIFSVWYFDRETPTTKPTYEIETESPLSKPINERVFDNNPNAKM